MPTLNDTELVQFKEWTLRIRPASVRPSRLLLMVHGWTGSEDSMWVFARDMPPENWIIAPRAPYPAGPGGYSWRRHDPGTQGRPSLELLQPSVEALVRLVDEYAHSVGVDAARFDVMGFSRCRDGQCPAMLHPERVRQVSGLCLRAEALVQRPLAGKKIFVSWHLDKWSRSTVLRLDRLPERHMQKRLLQEESVTKCAKFVPKVLLSRMNYHRAALTLFLFAGILAQINLKELI
jgi:pimeloyl-ACP methyl ester carboxylesterase